jgi:hypothetical protein
MPRKNLFEKGHAPHPKGGRPPGSKQRFTPQLQEALLTAVTNVGDRKVLLMHAKLPKRPTKEFTQGVLDVLRQIEPKGLVSYLEWLAEDYPTLVTPLLGLVLRAQLPNSVDNCVDGPRSAEEIHAALRAKGLPPLRQVFEFPPLFPSPNGEDADTA